MSLKDKIIKLIQTSQVPQKWVIWLDILRENQINIPENLKPAVNDWRYYPKFKSEFSWGLYDKDMQPTYQHPMETQIRPFVEGNVENLISIANKKIIAAQLERIKKKFNLNENDSRYTIAGNLLNIIYTSYDKDPKKFANAFRNLKMLLIQTRLSAKFPTIYANNKEKTGELLSKFIQGEQKAFDELAGIYNDITKLNTILNKFPILRKLESPEQVKAKVEDLVISQLQEMFAAEWRVLNGVTEQVIGEGTYYRGIPGHLLTRDIILDWISHAYDHRAKKNINQDLFSEFNYEFETPRSFISNFHDFVSSAVATSATPTTAMLYGVGYKANWPTEARDGWIIEIRTKEQHRVINLAEYKEGHAKNLDEFDFASIRTEDIYAFHHVKKEQDVISVVETIPNPNYKHSSRQEATSFFQEKMQIKDVFQSYRTYYDEKSNYNDIISAVDIKYSQQHGFMAVIINKNPLRALLQKTKAKESIGKHELFMQHYKEIYIFARYNDLYRSYEQIDNSFFKNGWKKWPEPYKNEFQKKIKQLEQELKEHEDEIDSYGDDYIPEDIFGSSVFEEILKIAENYFNDKNFIKEVNQEIDKKRKGEPLAANEQNALNNFFKFKANLKDIKDIPNNTSLPDEQFSKIKQLISTLETEIKSKWPYPNKLRKKEKVEALKELLKLCENQQPTQAVEAIENDRRFQHVREGMLSKRTSNLLDEIKFSSKEGLTFE